jgi:Type II secretion system (T2SS), protein F
MGLTGWALLSGATAAAGLVLLAVGLLPAGPPDLAAALARLDTRPPPASAMQGGGRGVPRLVRAVGGWLAGHTPQAGPLAAPAADLRLMDLDPARFQAVRAGVAAGGLAAPAVVWAVGAVAGLGLLPAVPAVVGLALAGLGWLAAAAVIRRRAAQARAQFRAALSPYLDLVALERAAAGSPVEALEAAAEVGGGPAFAAIGGRLTLAARLGASPYAALADLAGELGVAELKDLADITAAAADGAAVYATLLAKARSLRNAVLADEQAAANAASERLVFPVVLIGTGFLLLLFYPAVTRLLSAG